MRSLLTHKVFFLWVAVLILGSSVSCSNNNVIILNESDPDSSIADKTEHIVNANPVTVLTENDFVTVETIELFNGKDLSGWISTNGSEPAGWTVQDGLLRLVDPQNGNDLLSQESFDNFLLCFEWRFGTHCNSGVKYKLEQLNGNNWIGLEYQIQDDANVEDGKIDDRRIASLFDVFPATASTKATDYPTPTDQQPTGLFRKGKIVVYGNHVEHWIDDELVLSFEIGSEKWKVAKANSKFKNQKNFGHVKSSPILLQSHGYPIDYRNIIIQRIRSK